MLSFFYNLSLFNQILLVYLILINIITFIFFGYDKLKAEWHTHRVRELTLWILTALGGSLGALLGMRFFHHKTKKNSFQVLIALIILTQILLIYLLMDYA